MRSCGREGEERLVGRRVKGGMGTDEAISILREWIREEDSKR
jgi:hypothetical protein